MKNTAYKIKNDPVPEKLSKEIQKLLKKGWEISGGVCVTSTVVAGKLKIIYSQAMTKKPTGNPNE